MKPVLLELVHLRTYPNSFCRICNLIKLSTQPLASSDIKQQFGGSFSLSLLAHNQHCSSSCNIKLPMVEISSILPSLPFLSSH